MKTWVKVLLGIVIAIILIIGVAFYATSGITDTTERFFAATRANNMTSAYAETSKSMQNENSVEKIAAFIKTYQLDKVAKTSWSSRSIENGMGTLEGTATTTDGGIIPLKISLVKEDGEWRINYITAKRAGMEGNAKADPPPLAVQVSAVQSTTNRFVESLDDPDFSTFHKYCDESVSLDALEKALSNARAYRKNLRLLHNARPTIDDTQVLNSDGVLEIKGHYDIAPGRYQFTYTLGPDGKDWKIFGFKYDLI